jgi:hypothetical protein
MTPTITFADDDRRRPMIIIITADGFAREARKIVTKALRNALDAGYRSEPHCPVYTTKQNSETGEPFVMLDVTDDEAASLIDEIGRLIDEDGGWTGEPFDIYHD